MNRHLYQRIFHVAIPIILANITIPLLGAVDIAMLGHTHDASTVAAISIGTAIFDLIFWSFSFLRMTTTGLVAQSPKNQTILHRALAIALIAGLLITFSKQPLYILSFKLFHVSPFISTPLTIYVHYRIIAAVPTLVNYVVMGYLFGQKNTRVTLLLTLLTNLSAIFFDFLFVFKLNFGIKGLAIANIIAETLTMLCAFCYLQSRYLAFSSIQFDKLICLTEMKQLLNANFDVLVRTLSLMIVFTYFTKQGAKLSPIIVSSNAILMNLNHLMSYTLDGFTISLEAFIGQAVGERNKALFMQTLAVCRNICIIGACIFSILFYLFGESLIGLFTSIHAIKSEALRSLPWLYGLPLIAVGSYILDGCYIGAIWTKDMRNSMLMSLLVFLGSIYLLQPLHVNGIWLAFYLFMLVRFLLLLYPFKKNIKSIAWINHS